MVTINDKIGGQVVPLALGPSVLAVVVRVSALRERRLGRREARPVA